jgi:hypothetical protein
VRARSFVAVAVLSGVLAGVFALALALTTHISGLSPRPAEAASRVKVTVNCMGTPEVTRVTNNTRHRIKVGSVGSIYRPRSNEPFHVGRTLRRGSTISFENGYEANHSVLTHQYIYENDVGSREGARVRTSIGRFADRCG